MAKQSNISIIFIVSLTLTFFFITNSTAKESVYDLLPKYGLPSGLLPNTVTDYTLSDDGRFVVYLENTCYIQFDYLVYYEKKITGKLSYGSISDLKGIQVQRVFIWFNVDEIRVDLPPSNSIYFQVGIINKKLNVNQFKTVHSCRNSLGSSPCSSISSLLPAPLEEIPMLLTDSGSSSTAYTFNGYALARAVAEPPPGLPGRVPGLAASTVYRLECLVVRLGS
ncbi:hypothetical protein QL285_071611 [Trifolium repens]|nr:hypothetical protein QL285_071611 [Trifolium repens]